MTDPVISVRDLRMRYGTHDVLEGVEFEVGRGEVICLLGPNGAGKTTTIEILEGFRMRSAGAVRVLGEDPARAGEDWRARTGVVLQSWRDHPRWTPRRLLSQLGGYNAPYSTPEIERPVAVDELLEMVGLARLADQKIVTLSGGSAGASTSRSGSSAGRSCCSSTSPRPASTRRRGASSTTSCTASRTSRARRSC